MLGWGILYAVLLAISSGPSAYTYATWAWSLIKGYSIWGGVVIFFVSVVGDMIPEWVLVRKPAIQVEAKEGA
jgi:hypothetical protein